MNIAVLHDLSSLYLRHVYAAVCVNKCIYVCIYIYTHTHTHIYIYLFIYLLKITISREVENSPDLYSIRWTTSFFLTRARHLCCREPDEPSTYPHTSFRWILILSSPVSLRSPKLPFPVRFYEWKKTCSLNATCSSTTSSIFLVLTFAETCRLCSTSSEQRSDCNFVIF